MLPFLFRGWLMLDTIFFIGTAVFFLVAVCLRLGVRKTMSPWEIAMGSIMAVGLTVYLVYALLRPEKF